MKNVERINGRHRIVGHFYHGNGCGVSRETTAGFEARSQEPEAGFFEPDGLIQDCQIRRNGTMMLVEFADARFMNSAESSLEESRNYLIQAPSGSWLLASISRRFWAGDISGVGEKMRRRA